MSPSLIYSYHSDTVHTKVCLYNVYMHNIIIMVFIAHKSRVAELEYLHCGYIHHHKCAPQSNQL